jgi:hypothetical protein
MPVQLMLVLIGGDQGTAGRRACLVLALSHHGLVWSETVHRYHNNQRLVVTSIRQRVLLQRALLDRILVIP